MPADKSKLHLYRLLNKLKIDLVLDVGANEGQFGTQLRTLGYCGEIHSFEPVAATYKALAAAAKNDLHWHTHPYALGGKEEDRRINISKNPAYASFLSSNTMSQNYLGSTIQHKHTEIVTISTLDQIFRSNPTVSSANRIFLKMDTQGFDLEVIRGAANSIEQITGIQTEIAFSPLYEQAPDHIAAFQTYQALGFNVSGIYPTHENVNTLNLLEAECFLVRN